MAQQIMSGYNSFLGIYDISADFARIVAELNAPCIDNTAINATARSFAGGLPEADIDYEGYWSEGTGAISDILNTYQTGTNTQLICYTLYAPTTGSRVGGFATQVSGLNIIREENIGDLGRIRFTCKNNYPVIPVVPLYGLSTRSGAGTNNGNTYILEAVPSGSTLYGFLCVTAVSGTGPPTLVVKLQSSPAGSGWTDRITFTVTSTAITEVKTLAGPITDTYWQQQWTIAGTNPVFTFTSAWGFK